MAIIYRTAGPWGAGSPQDLEAEEVDGNFFDLASRLGVLEGLPIGVFIEDVSFTGGSITFHLSDDTIRGPFPLPVALFNPVGEWANDMALNYLDLVTVSTLGLFVVLIPHTTPSSGDFDPDADDGTTDANPLYKIVVPLNDLNYDIGLSIAGTMVRDTGALICKIVVPRAIRLAAGLTGAYAHLGSPVAGGEATDATTLSLGIYKNLDQIGTITFEAGEDLDGSGGQFGNITFTADVDFAASDRLRIVATLANDEVAADLSISIPSTRLDI